MVKVEYLKNETYRQKLRNGFYLDLLLSCNFLVTILQFTIDNLFFWLIWETSIKKHRCKFEIDKLTYLN